MKVISYSIFGDPSSFEFRFYLRGVYFNARMNRLLYPEWQTCIFYEDKVIEKLYDFNVSLSQVCGNIISRSMPSSSKCESMLWRILPLMGPRPGVTHVICRDADAITTYKEAQSVHEWIDSGLGFHGITDDPAHTIPMMGGMSGFKVDHFKNTFPEYDTFEKLIGKDNLKDHGSDQNLLMKKIYPKAKGNMMGHFFKGCKENVKIVRNLVSNQIPGVSPKLWESNNTCRMIGSPGVVDFELLRFFKRFDNNQKFDAFERKYSDVMYWAK